MRLDSFFENPTILGAIVIIVFILGQVAQVYFQNKNGKKMRNDNKSSNNDVANKIQLLIDKERNNLSLQASDEVLRSYLRRAENTVKNEVMRIFHHNNRDNRKRQIVITKSVNSIVTTVYDSCINSLKKLYYKEKSISEFITYFDTQELADGLLSHIFDKSENDIQDMQDSLYYVETYFTSIITNAKSYSSNL